MTETEKSKKPKPIIGATIKSIGNKPVALYKGDKPSSGETLVFSCDNGVTYTGKVSASSSANGQVTVEFDGPINPEPKTAR